MAAAPREGGLHAEQGAAYHDGPSAHLPGVHEGSFPVRLLKTVHWHYFLPDYDECKSHTIWSPSNAFTSATKEARDDKRYELTARLSKFLAPYSAPSEF